MPILTVNHKTVYRYARPVQFGEHRLMFRPRDSHDLRLLDTALLIQPTASVRWLFDVFGNSIAIASFTQPAAELVFESTFRAEQFLAVEPALVLEPYAQRYPCRYSANEIPDLGRTIERGYADPGRKIDTWAHWFVEGGRSLDTMDILIAMTRLDPSPVCLCATRGVGNPGPDPDPGDPYRKLPRLRALHDGSGAQPRVCGTFCFGVPV